MGIKFRDYSNPMHGYSCFNIGASFDPSVYEQLRTFVITESVLAGQKIYFGIIDVDDAQRLMMA